LEENNYEKERLKILISSLVIVIIFATFAMTTFAAGNCSGAIEKHWNSAKITSANSS
jgi:hypothetical protein